MNIEIISSASDFEVIESLIRDVRSDDYSNAVVLIPNFQAIISNKTGKPLGDLELIISYFDENEMFLGHHKGIKELCTSSVQYSVSLPVTLPDNVHRIKCTVSTTNVWDHSFKSWSYRAAAILCLALLFQWVLVGFFKLFGE